LMDVLTEVYVLLDRELKKWYRSPFLMTMTIIQPVIWMGLFGKALNLTGMFQIPKELLSQLPPAVTSQIAQLFNRMMVNLFGTAELDYFSYMSVGMLSIVILFTSMSSGMSIAWDRRLGFLNKLLVSPIKRGSIIISKVLSGVVKSVMQAILVMLFAAALGAKYNLAGPLAPLVVLLALTLLSLGLSSLFVSLAVRLKSWESQMAVMNLLNLPLMFASNALYPIKLMPSWLQVVASANPISYAVDAVRQALLLGSSASASMLLLDLGVLAVFALALAGFGVLVADRGLRRS